jgi:hypothetical protein
MRDWAKETECDDRDDEEEDRKRHGPTHRRRRQEETWTDTQPTKKTRPACRQHRIRAALNALEISKRGKQKVGIGKVNSTTPSARRKDQLEDNATTPSSEKRTRTTLKEAKPIPQQTLSPS